MASDLQVVLSYFSRRILQNDNDVVQYLQFRHCQCEQNRRRCNKQFWKTRPIWDISASYEVACQFVRAVWL